MTRSYSFDDIHRGNEKNNLAKSIFHIFLLEDILLPSDNELDFANMFHQ